MLYSASNRHVLLSFSETKENGGILIANTLEWYSNNNTKLPCG